MLNERTIFEKFEECDSVLYDAFRKSQNIEDYRKITERLGSIVTYDKGLKLGGGKRTTYSKRR